ncbi:hypothetical protein LSF60_05495 [Rhodococcus pyridinivorans]|uniref:hypothetical protein n=1 Tax=Rhodococcus pyridinivorans TaxID=103816 RepID=UPI001E33BD0F|nr:hypothetical protein [Rhodococcus pyridinivorans]UGQ58967.1 hypothetical protein LSF60_05495 [Rhodococcus pyridinivorans]
MQVLGSALLLQGSSVLYVLRALKALIRAHAREQIAPPPEVLALLNACQAAVEHLETLSDSRHDDTTSALVQQDSSQHIGTKEAAAMLGVTQRQAQRLAPTLEGRRLASGAWVFDRDTVAAYAHAINERNAA